ncbi:MAG: G1 family glutamic endopeptidase [Candidatus Levyibacteriota bacterium]
MAGALSLPSYGPRTLSGESSGGPRLSHIILIVFSVVYIFFLAPYVQAGAYTVFQGILSIVQPASTTHPIAVEIPAPNSTPSSSNISRNWSGYVSQNGSYTGVSATWTVPNPTTSSGNYGTNAEWVGIGGSGNADLIQAGTQAAVDRMGNASYEAFYETLPDPSTPFKIDVAPGDSITATVTKGSGSTFNISIKNNTNNQSVSLQIPYNSSLSSADWIEEAPSGGKKILPLSDFGTVAFTNAWAIKDGKKVNIQQSGSQPVTMQNFMGTLATASSLSEDGSSFQVKYAENATKNQVLQEAFLARFRHTNKP